MTSRYPMTRRCTCTSHAFSIALVRDLAIGRVGIKNMWLQVAVCVLLVWTAYAQNVPKLQKYNVTAADTSISGLSSGGYMAVQFHVAFSETLRGAGITAGGPYYCAYGEVATALTACVVEPVLINVPILVEITKMDAEYGYIDATSNLENSRVFLISGTKDRTVEQGVVEKLYEYYTNFVKTENIGKNFSIPAGHSQITNDYGNRCDLSATPYLVHCDYPSGYVMLNFIYGDVKYASDSHAVADHLLEFDQSEFFGGSPDTAYMDAIGYVYVPESCQNGETCRLHIAFHGCNQEREAVGNIYAMHAGYNAVAEVNNIIVLYPQAAKSLIANPEGCWDWWGYTDRNYAYKNGQQMAGVKKMLDRVTAAQACSAHSIRKSVP